MATLTLQVISGPSIDRSVVRARGRLLIGRSSNADLRLADADVHWEHCVVQVGDETITLVALTPNATLVNGRPVSGAVRLRDRDVVTLSSSSKVRVSAPALRTSSMRNVALAAMATVAVIVALVAVAKPTLHLRSDSRDWERSYLVLARALDASSLDPRIAEDLSNGLQRAWRRERSEEVEQAVREYGELTVRLAAILRRTPERAEELQALAALEAGVPRRVEGSAVSVALHGFARARAETLRGG